MVKKQLDEIGLVAEFVVRKFDYNFQKKCVEKRDYEELELYVLELLMKS